MGCICGKPSLSVVKDGEDSPGQRELNRKTCELRVARAASNKRAESFSSKDNLEQSGDVKAGLIDRKVSGSRRVRDDCQDKKREISPDSSYLPVMGNVPKAVEGEQVAAGWPSWLVAVAGEAISGWVPRKPDTFEKLDKIGQGTYSTVYKGRDLANNKFVALKKVRFDNMDPESVKFMAREILILRNLDHPNVIKLEGMVTSRTSCSLYLVFEYMEHDLTGLASLPGVKFTEPQVKCYMHQLLSGLDYCHSHGVLHRDIKGSNLLIDNNGNLKIADFGLASYFDNNNRKVQLTSRVVTLWYRPPELLLGATQYGVAVDLWSTGCILGELYAGKPIMAGRTEVEQLHKIFKLCGSPSDDYWRKSKLPHSPAFKTIQPYRQRIVDTFKDLSDDAIRLMQTLLSVDPSDRGTASSALQSEFFKTEPLACDPSSLPQYPPSKEIDAKLREDEARRQGVKGVKGQKCEIDFKRSKESRSVAAPNSGAEFASLMQRRHGHVNPKGRRELFSPHDKEDCNSGPLTSGRRNHNPTALSSGMVAPRAFGSIDGREKSISSHMVGVNQVVSSTRHSESFGDPVRNQGDIRRQQGQIYCGSQHSEIMDKQAAVSDGHGHEERPIPFSGPLLASNNIEQVLKEHDRRIHAAARRIRHEKTRVGRIRPQEAH